MRIMNKEKDANLIHHTYRLSNDVEIPKIGFGTWKIKDGKETYDSVTNALKIGYRHIDTATVYGNEKSVGKAIKDSGIARDSLFVTTKLPADIKGFDSTFVEFDKSLKRLGLEYIDLYLIHAPWPWNDIGRDYT
ncbi:MAG: aldo/keto reductase, partial [Bacteroidia bacterium]|nr:aldo/keto reductase [Bacteroidia bacterium]